MSIYNGILLGHKKEQNNAICSNMDTIRDFHIKRSQTEKDKYHMRYNFHDLGLVGSVIRKVSCQEVDLTKGKLSKVDCQES